MTEPEAIEILNNMICMPNQLDAKSLAIKALEMQEKLKEWIAGYKHPDFAGTMVTRDDLIDILQEFVVGD